MSGASEQDEEEGGGLSLPSIADVLRLLRKRAGIIIACTIVMGLSSLGLLALLTPQYVATASVLIDPREKNIADMKEVTEALVANTPTIESEVEILKSSEVAGRVIDDMKLGDNPELNGEDAPVSRLKRLWRRLLGKPVERSKPAPASLEQLIEAGAQDDGSVNPVVAAFIGRVSTERVRETFLIDVGYRSSDPELAARIANALADAYVHTQIEAKMRAAEMATTWLDRRIAELRERVYDAERIVEEFKSQNGLIDSEGYLLDGKQVARQMEQLVLARTVTAEARAKYENVKRLLSQPNGVETLGDVLAAHTITALKQQLADATRAAAELRTKYGPAHPNMLKAEAKVRDAEQQLEAEVERIVANLESELHIAEEREARTLANMHNIKKVVADSASAMVRLRELEREATAAREVYEGFLKRAQETAQQENLQMPDARVVDRATVPGSPTSPKRMLILIGGFGGGLVLGLMLAVLLELLFPSFVRTEMIEGSLKSRFLTSIPLLAAGGASPAERQLRLLRRIILEPRSPFAEAIRAVRIAIERNRQGDGPVVVLVTSTVSGEGKSVVASNLALQYALSGVRTVLVDCNLRGSGLSRSLLPGCGLSLVDCIMTRLPVRNAIVRENATGLHFLPATSEQATTITAGEVLASPPMAAALRSLAKEFEVIVLDSQAVMSNVDASILGSLADQVVFVHKWRSTSRAAARQALRMLGAGAEKVTGVVVNQVEEAELGSTRVYEQQESLPPREPRLAA